MPWKHRTLQSRTVESSDSQTKVVKLPTRGALSALLVHCEMTNGATSGRAVSMLDVIDTVEILANGDRPIISLNSDELLRWQRCWTRQFNHLIQDEQAGAVQEWYMPLMFGRQFGDMNYWLPMSNFQDLELRVAYTPNIAADSGFATGTFTMTVLGVMMDDDTPGSFNGFFRTLNKHNFTSVASGDTEIDLPHTRPYLAVMVYAHESGVAYHTDISQVKLERNNGSIIWYDGRAVDLVRENHYMLGLKPERSAVSFSQAAETMETYFDYLQAVNVTPGNVATIGTSATPLKLLTTKTGGLITPQGILKDGDGTQGADIAENADLDYYVQVSGIGLGKAAVLDFDPYFDSAQPFNSANFDKVKLVLTNAGAGATVRTSLSELVQSV